MHFSVSYSRENLHCASLKAVQAGDLKTCIQAWINVDVGGAVGTV